MNEHDMNVTNMLWQPAMLELTAIAHPEVEGGVPTRCFVSPDNIAYMYRTKVKQMPIENPDGPPVFSACTIVVFKVGGHIAVDEKPQAIAVLRDRALGHSQKLAPA